MIEKDTAATRPVGLLPAPLSSRVLHMCLAFSFAPLDDIHDHRDLLQVIMAISPYQGMSAKATTGESQCYPSLYHETIMRV